MDTRAGPRPDAAWFGAQRWFAGNGGPIDKPPALRARTIEGLRITLVDVGADTYQLVGRDGHEPESLETELTQSLVARTFATGLSATGGAGTIAFRAEPGVELDPDADTRLLG